MSKKSEIILMTGGLNLTDPASLIKPGECIQAYNYELDLQGRYVRVGGYERFDGQPRPSEFDVPDAVTDDEYYTRLFEGISQRRAVIQAVPGSGPVRGVVTYLGDVYAWRDNADGTALRMYKSSIAGWEIIATPHLDPGGNVEAMVGNFKGNSHSMVLYGCDGVNPAFSYDINTDMYTQAVSPIAGFEPYLLEIFKEQLFLAFPGGQLINSVPGEPLNFDAVAGAGHHGIADEISAIDTQPGGALMIACNNSTHLLYGNNINDFNMQQHSSKTGAKRSSVQTLSEAIYLDDRGITLLSRSQSFGNYDTASISQKIRPIVDRYRQEVVASCVVRAKNQYRLFFSDGSGLIGTFVNGAIGGWTRFDYATNVATCVHSGEDLEGKEHVYMGSEDGFVYELEVGRSFDGTEIEAVLRLAFMHQGDPSRVKRYTKVLVEGDAESRSTFRLIPDFEFSSEDLPAAVAEELVVGEEITYYGGSAYWGSGVWGKSKWGVPALSRMTIPLTGSATNIGFVMYSKSAEELAHTIHSLTIDYIPRGRRK